MIEFRRKYEGDADWQSLHNPNDFNRRSAILEFWTIRINEIEYNTDSKEYQKAIDYELMLYKLTQ